jgi:glycosyltransferase involved in cell wall biosynthesis
VSRPLRVCVIASSRFPVREPFMGGLEAHTHALASRLIRRGHTVSVFAAPGSDPDLGATAVPVAEFRTSTAARSDVGSPPEAWMQEHHAYLDLMLSLARGVHGPFDVIHNNSLHHLPVAMTPLLNTPMVTVLHTPPVPWLESAVGFAAPGTRFIAVSHAVRRAWRRTVSSHTIHNGVDVARWTPGGGGGPALWSGRIVPEKAPHEALLAARAAGLRIDLAGPVHDQSYFAEHVQPLLANPSARYLGHLDADGLRHAVAGASVAVVTPQWEEPFGLVAAEALSCGTPVAAYDRGALTELIDEHTGVLAPAGDIPALAEAMRRAATLDRAAARRRAVEHFSLDHMVDGYEQVYADISRVDEVA